MSERTQSDLLNKQCGFEQLEDRRVFSGQSVADIAIDTQVVQPSSTTDLVRQVEVTSESLQSEAFSDAKHIEQQYGFDGGGQTVAVIDSGIAWDHYALGGGLGEGHRVVGGWDFAENDSDPYDDGGAGYHGTHVSGIIGSSDETHRGVSSGVDLVGLRVFDDAGNGNIDWVESALQWVHEHKDDFENPITTVNLSLGTEWNASNAPEWATLEDELAQLEQDGIFIAVAAGNAFEDYHAAGLSYPAVSEHVVPVASHDDQGNMSDFSQRDQGVLVAPGESIKSTVPDHLFGGTRTGAFAGSSGTSMASPFVAGASTIVRQAMEFMGHDDIDQDAIYQIFRDTSDSLFDAVTNQTYDRLNLKAAIDAIVSDVHSNQFSSATDIGTVMNHDVIRGTIGKISDVDAFEFTATTTGQITFQIQASDDLVANFDLQGGDVSVNGNQVSFLVEQGEQYRFSIKTAAGIGHYEITAAVSQGTPATNWGIIDHEVKTDIQVVGEKTFQFNADRNGILTLIGQTDSNITLTLYDQNMVEQTATSSEDGQVRFDVGTRQGKTFYLKAVGFGNFDASLSNLVSLQDGTLEINGTDASDSIRVYVENQFEVEINSVNYQFQRNQIDTITIDSGDGFDSVRINLDDTNDHVRLGVGSIAANNQDFLLRAENSEQNTVFAGGGINRLLMSDSEGDDVFSNSGHVVAMVMNGMANYGVGFNFVEAVSSAGDDSASLRGSSESDKLVSSNDRVNLTGAGRNLVARGFDQVSVHGGGGHDTANLYDSAGNDQFVLRPGQVVANTDFSRVAAAGFERVNALAFDGNDSVVYFDSENNDRFFQRNNLSSLDSGSHVNVATGFDNTSVNSTGGYDIAQINGSNQSDVADMNVGYVTLQAGNDFYQVTGFERTNIVAGLGGIDVANMIGTDRSDSVYANPRGVSMSTDGTVNRAVGFGIVNVDAKGGLDSARLFGGDGIDKLTANRHTTTLDTQQTTYLLKNFEIQKFDGQAGFDVVALSGFGEDDSVRGFENSAEAQIGNVNITADNFSFLDAATDLVSKYDMAAADYLFMLDGNWEEENFSD